MAAWILAWCGGVTNTAVHTMVDGIPWTVSYRVINALKSARIPVVDDDQTNVKPQKPARHGEAYATPSAAHNGAALAMAGTRASPRPNSGSGRRSEAR
jgi:hypothetical protein